MFFYSVFQISSSLLNRVANVDQNFYKDMDLIPRVSPEFELTLDTAPVVHSIQTMNFFQMKGKLYVIVCVLIYVPVNKFSVI